MNTNENAARPLSLLSAIGEFLRESLRARGSSILATTPQYAGDLSPMQLYRLTRGRETVDPAIGALLANRFQ